MFAFFIVELLGGPSKEMWSVRMRSKGSSAEILGVSAAGGIWIAVLLMMVVVDGDAQVAFSIDLENGFGEFSAR